MVLIVVILDVDWNVQWLWEKELVVVKINFEDVDIIVNELEMDKKVVERMLREYKGDVVVVICFFLKQGFMLFVGSNCL